MQRTEHKVSEHALTLDQEVSLWSKKGYRVLNRTASTVQLSKRHDSPLLLGAALLLILSLFLVFVTTILTLAQGAGLFVIGTFFLAAYHANRGEHLVYLTVTSSGEITQD